MLGRPCFPARVAEIWASRRSRLRLRRSKWSGIEKYCAELGRIWPEFDRSCAQTGPRLDTLLDIALAEARGCHPETAPEMIRRADARVHHRPGRVPPRLQGRRQGRRLVENSFNQIRQNPAKCRHLLPNQSQNSSNDDQHRPMFAKVGQPRTQFGRNRRKLGKHRVKQHG